jgi:hypothetical protein
LWVRRPTFDDQRSASKDQGGLGKTTEDQAETPEKATLKEGATETQGSEVEVQPGLYMSRVVLDEVLQRLGIVKAGDGRYIKASVGPGGSIVLRSVDLRA